MGIVHGLQKGTVDPSKVSKKAKEVAKHMKPSAAKDFAATKHKGLPVKKKAKHENKLGEVYVVTHAKEGKEPKHLVKKINPLEGIHPHGIGMEEVYGIYGNPKEAEKVAGDVHAAFTKRMEELEEKKHKVSDQITKAIEAYEEKRKHHVEEAKSNPLMASKHKQHIAKYAQKIDELMEKLEKVEKSKKPIKKEGKK
jgi:uncharacterized coiled-coil protein SlyX